MIAWAAVRAFLRGIPREVWLGLALVAIALLLIWRFYAWAYERGEASKAGEVAAVQALLEQAQQANAGMQATIARLQEVNDELAQGRLADREAAQEAVARIEKERDQLARSLAAARREREKLYESSPYARAWADAGWPAAVADGLFGPAPDRSD